jgi:hypothetical protein
MSPFRRIAAGAALFVLAMSAFAVPACEWDSTRPRSGKPEVVRQSPPPPQSAQAPSAG